MELGGTCMLVDIIIIVVIGRFRVDIEDARVLTSMATTLQEEERTYSGMVFEEMTAIFKEQK